LGKLEVLDVIREISPKDRMVTPRYPETYFLWGDSALRCIGLAMAAVGKQETASILDFPCGHGRVLRTLKSAFPDAKLTACDIDSDGVDFCERTFDAQGVYSNADLNQVDLDGNFDVIWVGSLFTHLPEARWGSFLSFLTDRLAPTGLLVFTTHGPWYAQQIREESSPLGGVSAAALVEMLRGFDETGFGFAAYPEFDDYGLSLSAPAEVTKRLQALDGMRLALYLERGWRGHQDVVAYQKGFTTPDL
jgi:SAM-dependent methyltransferase